MPKQLNDHFTLAYERLNEAQRKAVDTTEGPLLVVAGPGTGKTELLALRVANILRTTDAAAANILCLTFTESGAENMRERLLRYVGADAYRVEIATFHGFCSQLISKYQEYFYDAVSFEVASDQDKARIILDIFKNLPFGHALGSFHSERGFSYLPGVLDRISNIKGAGYTVDAYKKRVTELSEDYDGVNEVLRNYPPGRNSIKRLDEFRSFQGELRKLGTETGDYLADTLAIAISEAESCGKTGPIGDWKKKFTEKGEEDLVYKDSSRIDRIQGVAEVYELYDQAMQAAALYDYDDMIIDAAQALSKNSALRNELEEQYQYILVDEFQDTNEAQMGLLKSLTSGDIHQGKPNIMVVGDDDQAIYKFQGAEISNIINYRKDNFPETQTIVLDINYRSHQKILDFSRSVVQHGHNRLENHFEDINKEISQGNQEIVSADISVDFYADLTQEYSETVQKINDLIAQGTSPAEIAVLSRNHKDLQAMIPYLQEAGIDYEYSKKTSVFEEAHIREIIKVIEYVVSVQEETATKDYLLAEILAFPYFQIKRETLYEIALQAKSTYRAWSLVTSEAEDPDLQKAVSLLADLSTKAADLPLEHLISEFIEGSGFKGYYFSAEVRKETPQIYIQFLAALKQLTNALREWRRGEQIYAVDLAPFISMHEERKITLAAESPLVSGEDSVKLMTVHAAKGLEFEAVLIIACHDKSWTKSSRPNIATVPLVLAPELSKAGDNEDDFIRLFYVALTRAKNKLIISGHEPLIRYLPEATEQQEINEEEILAEDYELTYALVSPPYSSKETVILKKLVENYYLPVTHLQNFLDLSKGGPLYFLEQNLIAFPSPMPAAAAYGSAVHRALEEMIVVKKKTGEVPELDTVLECFEKSLKRARLLPHEYQQMSTKGQQVLSEYYKQCGSNFQSEDLAEINFRNEGVCLGEARLTGKIDLLRAEDDGYLITDFKTGKNYSEWQPARAKDYEQIKLHHYRQQLCFYQLLIENSKNFPGKVKDLTLEFVDSVREQPELVTLSYQPEAQELERLAILTQAVYQKIVNLDFPDISHYPEDIEGIVEFEADLVNEFLGE